MTTGPMTLTVLGCDGSYPGPAGAGSGYLVRAGGTSLWLDAGPGTLANLQTHLAIEDIDAIMITHEHVDHWSDLEHLAIAIKYVIEREPVPLFCPPGLVSLMRFDDVRQVFDVTEVGPQKETVIGPLALTFTRTDHPVDTLAVRVDGGGRSLGYSADSGPGWSLAALGAGLDLAICEATFLSDMEDLSLPHMSARQAGSSAHEAGVGKLVITHLWPRVDRDRAAAEASASFGRPVEVAAIGRQYEV